MNLKITATVFAVIILSFSIIYYTNDWYKSQFGLDNVSKWEEHFFSQEFDPDTKRIFILGASHTARVNATHLQNGLMEHDYDFEVFNLSKTGDRPASRVNSIDTIISADPELIVYGLAFRDFQKTQRQIRAEDQLTQFAVQEQVNLLPEPQSFYARIFGEEPNFDLENLENPKLTTLQLIDLITGKRIRQYHEGTNHPFIPENPDSKIRTLSQLEKQLDKFPFRGYVDPESPNIDALKLMIEKFQSNNIIVILYSTPHHQLFLDTISEKDKQEFFSIIKNISEESDVPIYYLHNEYSDKNIWSHVNHIATGHPEVLVYTDDIKDMVLKELN